MAEEPEGSQAKVKDEEAAPLPDKASQRAIVQPGAPPCLLCHSLCTADSCALCRSARSGAPLCTW